MTWVDKLAEGSHASNVLAKLAKLRGSSFTVEAHCKECDFKLAEKLPGTQAYGRSLRAIKLFTKHAKAHVGSTAHSIKLRIVDEREYVLDNQKLARTRQQSNRTRVAP